MSTFQLLTIQLPIEGGETNSGEPAPAKVPETLRCCGEQAFVATLPGAAGGGGAAMTPGAVRMQLLVKTPLGHTIAVDGEECGTVGGLKRHIEEREGISAHAQRIVGRGRALRDDSAALASVGLGDGAMVEVLLGLRGGAKKGGKKAKVQETPEEKMLREATEKLKGEEDRRRKEEAMRQYLTNGLQEEEKFAKLNLAKIQNQWRKLMRLAKVESLRKDLEIMSQNHEREVDMKDAIIQMLDRDLDEAEEQYQMALRSHLQNVDALIDLYNSKVGAHCLFPSATKLRDSVCNTVW